jgi:hypothetical protein
MKLPSFGWKFNAAVLSVVFLAGCFIGQAPYREVMQANDANTVTKYWVMSRVTWPIDLRQAAASYRRDNEIWFQDRDWKSIHGEVQIAQIPKP